MSELTLLDLIRLVGKIHDLCYKLPLISCNTRTGNVAFFVEIACY